MTRPTLSVLAALALMVSVGTANAGDPIPANPIPGHRAPRATPPAAPRAASLNLDFGTLPAGWEATRNPDGNPRGIINMIENEAADARIFVFSDMLAGHTVEEVVRHVAGAVAPATGTATAPVKDADGNWSFEVAYLKDGKPFANGIAIFRTFKNDPGALYLFKVQWPNTSNIDPRVVRGLSTGAKLK